MSTDSHSRVAFSPGEFAQLFGKSQTWGYRQLYSGKVKAITEHGRLMIPASEVERVLGSAGVYDGLKPAVPRKKGKRDMWREFLSERRAKGSGTPKKSTTSGKSARFKGMEREGAFARLVRKDDKSRRER